MATIMLDLTNRIDKLSIDVVFQCINEIVSQIVSDTEDEIKIINKIIYPSINYEIEKEPSLKMAHLYCVKNQISPQVCGNLIENFMISYYKLSRNKSSSNTGDLCINNINYELKISFGGKTRNKFNYVQIRMNHNCSYLLTAYHICKLNIYSFGQLFVFRLSKNDMIKLIFKYGSYAHGTKKSLGPITMDSITNISNTKEYALRCTYGSKCWNQLLLFSIDPTNI